MKQVTQNTFTDGLVMDMNPLLTPSSAMTDALNATLITLNGNEFTLQSDIGNVNLDVNLGPDKIPVGMKEYGGVLYIASLSPSTGMCEIGSIPAPVDKITANELNKTENVNYNQTKDEVNPKLNKLFTAIELKLYPGDSITFRENLKDNTVKGQIYNYQYFLIDDLNVAYPIEVTLVDSVNNEYQFINNTSISGYLAYQTSINNIEDFNMKAFPVRRFDNNGLLTGKANFTFNFTNKDWVKVQQIKLTCENLPNWTMWINNVVGAPPLTSPVAVSYDVLSDITQLTSLTFNATPINNYGEELVNLTRQATLNYYPLSDVNISNIIFQHKLTEDSFTVKFDYYQKDITSLYVKLYDPWNDVWLYSAVNEAVTNDQIDYTATFNISGAPTELENNGGLSNDNIQEVTGDNCIEDGQKIYIEQDETNYIRPNHFYVCYLTTGKDDQFAIKKPLVTSSYLNPLYEDLAYPDFTILPQPKFQVLDNSLELESRVLPTHDSDSDFQHSRHQSTVDNITDSEFRFYSIKYQPLQSFNPGGLLPMPNSYIPYSPTSPYFTEVKHYDYGLKFKEGGKVTVIPLHGVISEKDIQLNCSIKLNSDSPQSSQLMKEYFLNGTQDGLEINLNNLTSSELLMTVREYRKLLCTKLSRNESISEYRKVSVLNSLFKETLDPSCTFVNKGYKDDEWFGGFATNSVSPPVYAVADRSKDLNKYKRCAGKDIFKIFFKSLESRYGMKFSGIVFNKSGWISNSSFKANGLLYSHMYDSMGSVDIYNSNGKRVASQHIIMRKGSGAIDNESVIPVFITYINGNEVKNILSRIYVYEAQRANKYLCEYYNISDNQDIDGLKSSNKVANITINSSTKVTGYPMYRWRKGLSTVTVGDMWYLIQEFGFQDNANYLGFDQDSISEKELGKFTVKLKIPFSDEIWNKITGSEAAMNEKVAEMKLNNKPSDKAINTIYYDDDEKETVKNNTFRQYLRWDSTNKVFYIDDSSVQFLETAVYNTNTFIFEWQSNYIKNYKLYMPVYNRCSIDTKTPYYPF